AGRVHRPEAHEPFADVEASHEFHDAIGQIHQLDALIGAHQDRFPVNRKAGYRGGCDLFDRTLTHGDGRTFAHALLVVGRPVCDQAMLRKISWLRQLFPTRLTIGRSSLRRTPSSVYRPATCPAPGPSSSFDAGSVTPHFSTPAN